MQCLREEKHRPTTISSGETPHSSFPPSRPYTKKATSERPVGRDKTGLSSRGRGLPGRLASPPGRAPREYRHTRLAARPDDGRQCDDFPTQTSHIQEHSGTHPRESTKDAWLRRRTTHKHIQKGPVGMIKTPFNCSASFANVAYFLHKTPREGMSRSMRLQCCAHDKSHACGSLFCSSFINIPIFSHLHHSLPREREGAPTGQEKTQSSATAPRTLSSRSLRLATVRRLTRLLYMSMDNVSTQVWRGAPRSCQVRVRCFPGEVP